MDQSLAYYEIDLNIEICNHNSHLYGTVALGVIITFSNDAAHIGNNLHVPVVGPNQPPDDFPNGLLSSPFRVSHD
jgi:hypothetical protein